MKYNYDLLVDPFEFNFIANISCNMFNIWHRQTLCGFYLYDVQVKNVLTFKQDEKCVEHLHNWLQLPSLYHNVFMFTTRKAW